MAACRVYHESQLPSTPLPHYLEITLNLLRNLSRQRGYCFAFNAALARMRGVHEATIGRHIKWLRDHGFIRVEFVGPDRRIFVCRPKRTPCVPRAYPSPLQSPETKQTTDTPPPAGAPPIDSDTPSPVVVALQAKGVAPPVARSLAAEYAERCRLALAHLPPAARNPAGWLVAAIKGGWQWPEKEKPRYVLRVRASRQDCTSIAPGLTEGARTAIEAARKALGLRYARGG